MKKLLLAAAVALIPGVASALTIDPTTYGACLGQGSCSIGDATLTAQPQSATFSQQNWEGVKGLGVNFQAGPTPGYGPEVQTQETIKIQFSIPQVIDRITLAHLYNPQTYGNDPQELARITATDSSNKTSVVTIQSVNNTSFNLTGSATLFGRDTGPGVFYLTDLFTNIGPVAHLLFEALPISLVADDTDYSIASIQTTPVPLPAAGLLFLGALGGLGALARRRSAGDER